MLFQPPEKYIIPSRRRATKRIQLNKSKYESGSKADHANMPALREKLRVNHITRDNLNVTDIIGTKSKKFYQSKIKDIMNLHRVKGSEPRLTKPKRIEENNSFDYSDVNVSRRIIRKMALSSLFDHKPFERAKFISKIQLSDKFLSKVDPVGMPSSKGSMSKYSKPQPLYNSVDFSNSLAAHGNRVNKTIDVDRASQRYNRLASKRLQSMYNHNSRGVHGSLVSNSANSVTDLIAPSIFAGKPTNADVCNKFPKFKMNSQNSASNGSFSRNERDSKSKHNRSNEMILSNPYRNNV